MVKDTLSIFVIEKTKLFPSSKLVVVKKKTVICIFRVWSFKDFFPVWQKNFLNTHSRNSECLISFPELSCAEPPMSELKVDLRQTCLNKLVKSSEQFSNIAGGCLLSPNSVNACDNNHMKELFHAKTRTDLGWRRWRLPG